MLKPNEAKRILELLEAAGHISGHETRDDGDACPAGKRYWGDIFIDGVSAEARIGSSRERVLSDLAVAAVMMAAGKKHPDVAVVVDQGLVADVFSTDPDVRVAIVDMDGTVTDPGTPNNYRESPRRWDDMDHNTKLLAESALAPASHTLFPAEPDASDAAIPPHLPIRGGEDTIRG
jgi:hypothetical protein